MPCLILVDASLSMLRLASRHDQSCQRKQMAEEGVRHLLQHLKTNFPLEFSSLMAFSSDCERVVGWTRDYDMLIGATSLGVGDKTNILAALKKSGDYCTSEWGVASPCQIIVVTDERPFLFSEHESFPDGFHYSFPFPCKLHFLVLTSSDDVKPCDVTFAQNLGNRFCDPFGSCYVYTPTGVLSSTSVNEMFQRLINSHFVLFSGELACGRLKSKITLMPPPMRMRSGSWADQQCPDSVTESKNVQLDFPRIIEICGFMHLSDLAGVPVISRHLVLDDPSLAQRLTELAKSDDKPSILGVKLESTGGRKASVAGNVGGTGGIGIRLERPDSSGLMGSEKADYGKMPSFRILLHGSLKVEGMAALTKLGDNWYGMLYSAADSRKKANLMLSIFPPHSDISWLGDLNNLTHTEEEDETEDPPFPVKPSHPLSYHPDSNLVWMKGNGMQVDVQKVLRHAKKLPDKQQAFLKDINKLRRTALVYGFHDVLTLVSDQLSRDASGMAPSEAALLVHVAKELRENFDASKPIASF